MQRKSTDGSEILTPTNSGQVYSVMNGRKIEGEIHEKVATHSKSISS